MKKVWLGICERIQKTESDETVFKGGRVFKGGGALLLSGSVRKLQAGSQETTKEASHNKSRCVCACFTINLGVFVPATKKLGVFVSACSLFFEKHINH